jgi:hypothetical protein
MRWWAYALLLLGIAAAALWFLVHPSVVTFLSAVGAVAIVAVVRCCVGPFLPKPKEVSGAAKWRVSLVMTAFCFGLPVLLAVQVTPSGGHGALTALFGPDQGFLSLSPSDLLAGLLLLLCLVVTPGLLIGVPARLHMKGRDSGKNSLVLGWLAGFAAFVAAGEVFVLHFLGDLLPKSGLGTLSVAAFGVAVLVAPFFKTVVSSCWRGGAMVVLDPVSWWSQGLIAFKEMRSNTAATQVQMAPVVNAATEQPAHDAE